MDIIPAQMRAQAELAMETSDVVLFLVDGKEGITASDREVAEMLRRKAEKVVLTVNKSGYAQFAGRFLRFL